MILHYIPKDQLRQHWEYIRHGLEIVRSKGHTDYIAEDVYCDCFEQRSMLFMGIVDNKPVGFVVLQPIGNRLHVWAAKMYWLITGFMTRNGFMLWGGGGGGPQTSESRSELDPTVRPFVEFGLGEAKNLYQTTTPEYFKGQTYVSPSAQTESALSLAEQQARAGSPLTQAALNQQLGTVQRSLWI